MIYAYIASILTVATFYVFALVLIHRLIKQHETEIKQLHDKWRATIVRCIEAERKLAEQRSGVERRGFQFEEVSAIPARGRG